MNSNQINNHSKLPYRNSTLDEFGRVRILSFDCSFANALPALENIVLAKLPSGQAKILSINLQYNNLSVQAKQAKKRLNEGETTVTELKYFLSQANELDPFFVEPEVDLKTVTLSASSGEIDTLINYKLESLSGVFINASVDFEIAAGSLFSGYILYVID